MRLAFLVLLVPALAVAKGPSFTTVIDAKAEGDDQTSAIAFTDATRTKTGTKLDTCWHKQAHVRAQVLFEAGKAKTVVLLENDDPSTKTCVTKALRALVLANIKDKVTITATLTGDTPEAKAIEALSHIEKVPSGPGFGAGVGTGVGQGTGGGGNGPGDFVSKGAGPGKGPSPPTVTTNLGPSTVTAGPLTAEQIDRVIKARAGIFRACYQKALNHDPGIHGKLVLTITIAADGVVKATTRAAASSLSSTDVETCIRSNLQRSKFPPSDGPTTVTYPMTFQS